MRNTILSGIICLLTTINPLAINTLHAQFEKIGQVVLSKGNLSLYEWNEFVMYCEAVSIRTKIPVPVLIGIAIHESAYFSSDLAKSASNVFGITALRDWNNRPIYRKGHPLRNTLTGKFENKSTPFRFYENRGESVYDFAAFISHQRYAKAWKCQEDIECWLEELKAAGYAQDPNWAREITSMLKRYDALNSTISRPSLGK